MKARSLVMLGTKKGAFVFESHDGRRTWRSSGPHFKGTPIYHVTFDPRTGTMLAAVNNDFQGPRIAKSRDHGASWKEGKKPPRFPKGSDWSVKQVWHVAPEESGAARLPPDGRFLVWASGDEGRKWSAMGNGLPRRSFFTGFSEGMDTDEEDPCGVYVGTGNGQLFFSKDGGRKCSLMADGLPPILSVNAATA